MPMPNTIPEIAFLLKEVERKYGREVHTSTDFESLSVVIERDINEYISSATLKRLWGYVSLKPAPRVATLDILCHFIGYRSFSEYKHALADKTSDETGFFSAFSISSQDLYPKDRLIIGWAPNKLITVEYKGGGRFEVINEYNTELQDGDSFYAACFILGVPLYIDKIDRSNGPTPPYVAGKNDGLNRLEKI